MKTAIKKVRIKEVPTRGKLVDRVQAVKDRLPKKGLSEFFLLKYPEYNNDKDKARLTNVLQLRTADEEITIKLEALAELIIK